MLGDVKNWLEKRRTARFVKSVGAWYKTCVKLTDSLGEVLYDQRSPEAEIEIIIGTADRSIFWLSEYTSDIVGLLRRRDPTLAQRVDRMVQELCRLRNETASFLIRCHRPGLFGAADAREEGMAGLYYYRAMEEAGFSARRRQTDLVKEIKLLWRDLQEPIQLAERSLALQPISNARRR